MKLNLFDYKLPVSLYRRFLMMTDTWEGTRAAPGSLLIKSYTGGEGLPFFWCGWPNNLPSFYEVLGKERSIYCICGTFAVTAPSAENIRALATYYAAEILKVQPQGPYLIGGFCEASLLSYEIAQILLAEGFEIGALILVECDVTEYDAFLAIGNRCFGLLDRIVHRSIGLSEAPIKVIKEVLSYRRAQLLARWGELKAKLGFGSVKKTIVLVKYNLSAYPGMATLIFVRWGELGYYQYRFFQRYWEKLVLGGTDFYILEGYAHYNPQNWSAVARIVHLRLTEAGY
jgi:hypothetical protein